MWWSPALHENLAPNFFESFGLHSSFRRAGGMPIPESRLGSRSIPPLSQYAAPEWESWRRGSRVEVWVLLVGRPEEDWMEIWSSTNSRWMSHGSTVTRESRTGETGSWDGTLMKETLNQLSVKQRQAERKPKYKQRDKVQSIPEPWADLQWLVWLVLVSLETRREVDRGAEKWARSPDTAQEAALRGKDG